MIRDRTSERTTPTVSKGRNRRRRVRCLAAKSVVGTTDEEGRLRRSPAEIAADSRLAAEVIDALRRKQQEFLAVAEADLTAAAKFLGREGCWAYWAENLTTARRFDCESDFRDLVFHKAAEFADIRMRKLTARYGPP